MPRPQVVKTYSFHLKIQMEIALILEWSYQKLAAPPCFFLVYKKKIPSTSTQKSYINITRVWKCQRWHLSTMLYQVKKWEITVQNHLQTQRMRTILNRVIVTVDGEKQFSVWWQLSFCPKLALLLTLDFRKTVSGFGLFCSRKSSFLWFHSAVMEF